MLRQRNSILSRGERFSYLVDERGLPDYWTTLFITVELRFRSTQNTILGILSALRQLELWPLINERNLILEFAAEKFLTSSDIDPLFDYLALKRSEVEKGWKIRQYSDVISLQVHHPQGFPMLDTVSTHTQKLRMSAASRFLVFVGKTMHRSSANRLAIYHKLDEMATAMRVKAPKVVRQSGLQNDPNFRSAPPEVYAQVLQLVRAENPLNPFRKNVRLRNQIMFDIMYETGVRGGEFLGLRIEDVDWTRQTLQIDRWVRKSEQLG